MMPSSAISRRSILTARQQQQRTQSSVVPGILNVPGGIRSQVQPPNGQTHRRDKARTTKPQLLSSQDDHLTGTSLAMPISQPSGRIARARAEMRNQSKVKVIAASSKSKHPSSIDARPTLQTPPLPSPLPAIDPPLTTPARHAPGQKRKASASSRNSSKLPSKIPVKPTKAKPRGKYRRQYQDELDLLPYADDHDLTTTDMELDDQELAESGLSPILHPKLPSTPPPRPTFDVGEKSGFQPLSSSSVPLGNAFSYMNAYLTPPHTPQRATTTTSHSRTPSIPFTSPIYSPFSPSADMRGERYANSTFQHSPSPGVLPKPRFLDGDNISTVSQPVFNNSSCPGIDMEVST